MNITGKVCKKHPELGGERYRANRRCVACHKEAAKAKAKRDYHDDPVKREAAKAKAREAHAYLKRRCVDHYGGHCAECAESDIDVLSIDHENGDGAAHRAEILKGRAGGSNRMYRWLIANGFPAGFRVLCFNHNMKAHLTKMRKDREVS